MDDVVANSIYEEPFARLKQRLQQEAVLDKHDADFVLRKRAAIALALESFIKLSEAGKAEFLRQLNKYNGSDYAQRRAAIDKMYETLQEMHLRHPKTQDCPCCGFRIEIRD